MNTIISIATIVAFLFTTSLPAQDKSTSETAKFVVSGNCEMCKKTIESALDTKGVKSAAWNQKTKQIEVVYNPQKITLDQIHHRIADAGYDTDKVKANDKAYQSLHQCCQYTRQK